MVTPGRLYRRNRHPVRSQSCQRHPVVRGLLPPGQTLGKVIQYSCVRSFRAYLALPLSAQLAVSLWIRKLSVLRIDILNM